MALLHRTAREGRVAVAVLHALDLALRHADRMVVLHGGRIIADAAPGEALPTVAALAEHYDVSKATVTRVLRILADEGLVRVVPRWGTFRA